MIRQLPKGMAPEDMVDEEWQERWDHLIDRLRQLCDSWEETPYELTRHDCAMLLREITPTKSDEAVP